MEFKQSEIDFTVHNLESNEESQEILDNGRKKFEGDCRKLFDEFMKGEVLNTFNSPVGDFRRRRQDLTDPETDGGMGFRISLHSKKGRLKNWFMSMTDMDYNTRKLNEILKK